ncbi:hypothetical protein GOP47_0014405 [Adiantum capillus-veneris]|uniref:Uncharacterized protein n=1 Tax=Adiantum capillus-veneris TaxID=13818 RepID=A0A9D4UM85_ADICA|nr:hypothetical protein GOP47_0014405 [Adiantum capillus-veneris]
MVQVCGESVECKVSAERMWHGLFKDAHNCLPKALPHHVLSVEYPHGQLGFHLPGHERLIKLHKALCEEVHEVEKHLKEEEALVKEEVEKVGKEVHFEEEKVGKELHKEEDWGKDKVCEVVGRVEKEAKEKVEDVGKEAHALKEEVHKGEHFVEDEVDDAAHEVAKVTQKVLEKEAKVAKKAANIVEKVLHKEGELLGATFHKVDAFLQHEGLWVKEKIEEVHHEGFKITISVLAGGLIGVLFKHCKHTFELKDTSLGHGSILHWTSEFETLFSAAHYLHAYEKLKQHALAPFHSVESYLLKHDDYTH